MVLLLQIMLLRNFTITTRFKRIAFTYIDSNGNLTYDEDVSCGNIESNVLTVNVAPDFDPSLTTGVPGNLFVQELPLQ